MDAAFAGTPYVVAADNEHIFYISKKKKLDDLGLKYRQPQATSRRRLLHPLRG